MRMNEKVRQIMGTRAHYSGDQPNKHTLMCMYTCTPKSWNIHKHMHTHTHWNRTSPPSFYTHIHAYTQAGNTLPPTVVSFLHLCQHRCSFSYTQDTAHLGTSTAELPSIGALCVHAGGGVLLPPTFWDTLFKSSILHRLSLSDPVQSPSAY